MEVVEPENKMTTNINHEIKGNSTEFPVQGAPGAKCPGFDESSSNDHKTVPPKKTITIMDDSQRSKVESARGRLESSKSNLRREGSLNTAGGNHRVSFTKTKTKTSYRLPIVYFVVNKDRMPRLAENFSDSEQQASMRAYATRSRHKFLIKKREQKRQKEERATRVKEFGTKVGLKVESVPTHHIPLMSRYWMSKQPNTPFNTLSERSEIKSPEAMFYNQDELTVEDKRPRGSSAGSDNYNMSEGRPQKPRLTPFDIELPGLKASENRSDTPGSCSSKKVHFSKNNPRSKSCNIQLPNVNQSAEEFLEAELKQSASSTTTHRSKTVLPVTTNTPVTKPRRESHALSLPKIDVITPIYDELILKTFQAFTTKKNPLSDRNTRAILQRVSAFLHPLCDTSDRKTPISSRPRTRETSFFSTQPPEPELELDYTDLSSSSITIDGKSMSMLMRDVESKQRRAQVPSTCFQMVPPGLDKEETGMSDRKPSIYIPSSC